MNCQSTLNLDLRIFAGIFTARRVIMVTQEKKDKDIDFRKLGNIKRRLKFLSKTRLL